MRLGLEAVVLVLTPGRTYQEPLNIIHGAEASGPRSSFQQASFLLLHMLHHAPAKRRFSNTVYPCFLLTVWVLALFHINLFHLNLEIRENFTPPNPKYSLPSQCSLFGPQYTSALQGAHPLLCFNVAHVYLPTAGEAYEKGAWGLKSSPNPLNNISWRLRPLKWKYLFSFFCCFVQDI